MDTAKSRVFWFLQIEHFVSLLKTGWTTRLNKSRLNYQGPNPLDSDKMLRLGEAVDELPKVDVFSPQRS